MDFASYAQAAAAYAQFFELAQAGMLPAMFGLAAPVVEAAPAVATTGKGKGGKALKDDRATGIVLDVTICSSVATRRAGVAAQLALRPDPLRLQEQ